MDPTELFRANLELIDRCARRICHRSGLAGADAEDFVSDARLLLMEEDYRVLRRYEGRSSLATFLTVVFSNLAADRYSAQRLRPSAEAVRLGAAAVLFEKLTVRDGRSIDEALPLVRDVDPTATRASLEALAGRLPRRDARRRLVELDPLPEVAVPASESAETRVREAEVRRIADRTAEVLRAALAELADEDRLLLRLRFASSMTVGDISRVLRVPPRPLYRQLERLLGRLRQRLTAAGMSGAAIEELIASRGFEEDVGLKSVTEARP